jgi:hypothetical protein
VGKVISTAENTQLFWEPFSPYNLKLYLNLPGKPWFYSVTDECSSEFKIRMTNLIENKFYKNHTNRLNLLLKYKFSPRKIRLLYRLSQKKQFYIPILKDPLALFSSEWLHDNFETKNIVIVRHPAGFISSLIKNNWSFDFTNFDRQPALLSNELSKFQIKIKEQVHGDNDILNQGILLWNMIHEYIDQLKMKHPEWYFIKLEDLALQPLSEFERIFNYLEIPMTIEVLNMIRKTTSTSNKTEREKAVNLVHRNSKEIIDIWKKRLSKSEQLNIHDNCKWSLFYSQNDWD